MEKTILLYHFAPPRAALVRKAASRLPILVKQVAEENYHLPIGNVAGVKGVMPLGSRREGEELDQEMLIFAGLSGEELDQVLLGLRRNGLTGIGLKAVLTQTNQYWNAFQLCEELKREHAAVCQEK